MAGTSSSLRPRTADTFLRRSARDISCCHNDAVSSNIGSLSAQSNHFGENRPKASKWNSIDEKKVSATRLHSRRQKELLGLGLIVVSIAFTIYGCDLNLLKLSALQSEQRGVQVVAADNDNEPQQLLQTSSEKKPKFIIHVGPMKTGTSSLQADLTWLMQPYLEKDGWQYITIRDPMHAIPMDDPEVFLQRFEEEAKKLRKLNKNFIRSREQYSVLFANYPWMYARLKEILRDWDVVIVAGYRPYFEYLTSKWYQEFRLPFSDEFGGASSRDMNTWGDKSGSGKIKLVKPIFPDYFAFWKDHSSFTDGILEPAKDHLPVKVFDIHDPRGSRTVFLCDVIGADIVPHACQESMRLDREKPLVKHNPSDVKEIFYDAIALAAASRGVVDTAQWKRTAVIDAIMERHEKHLSKTIHDFPLDCPSQDQLDELWAFTLRLDEQCVPDLSKDNPKRIEKLRADFQKAVDRKKFCLVDANAVLEDAEWQEFLKTFQGKQ